MNFELLERKNMELNVSKHSPDDEISLSTDVFKFLQQDHNLLTLFEQKFFCEICAKAFSEENDLHYHRLDHIVDKPLIICDDPVKESVSENCMPSEDKKICQTYDNVFTCERCHKCFSTISCLRIHQRFFHFEYIPIPDCHKCGSHFKWKHHLAVHKYADSSEETSESNTCNINTKEEPDAPDTCDNKPSIIKDDLHVLDSSHDHQKPDEPITKEYVCYLCRRGYTLRGNLRRHVLTVHTRNKSLASKFCGKKYSKKTKANNHIKIHTKKTPFICNICNKPFTHVGFLNRHLRRHSEGKVFCKVCQKGFIDDITLQQHLITHSDEKFFACHLCSKSFECQNDLDCHLRIHSDEKPPYPCDFCGRRFIRKGCLVTHIMRLHSGQRPA